MTVSPAHQRIFCALDTDVLDQALTLAQTLRPHIGGLKLGLEFFSALGGAGVRAVAETGAPIFLDLKLHDIPNTVAGAVRALTPLAPTLMTVHAQGGRAMMAAAADAAAKTAARLGLARPRIIAVTVLTSLDDSDLESVGIKASAADQVLRLAELAKLAGLDGVVCSPHEIRALRERLGPDFLLVVPGIRPAESAHGDQKRVMTPEEAVAAGASHLVIGRPITAAPDPAAAAQKIATALDRAL